MAKAGWCPVTHARCANEAIRLERFGDAPNVFITVLNTDKQAAHEATIVLDLQALGMPNDAQLTDMFTGNPLQLQQRTVKLNIAADDIAVVRVAAP